ncbi:FMN-binding protein MioC [Escherichia coli]
MADITLISGSTLGGARYVAEHLAEKLEEAGFTTETLHGPLLEDLSASGIWLIISSTHGAGDIPDNLLLSMKHCRQKPDLSAVRFGAIGIGSREYDTFCGAIDKLEAELKNSGAKQTGETLKINILDHDIPEDPAEEWLGSWINLLKSYYRSCDLLWITLSGSLDQPVVIQRTRPLFSF